MAEYHRDEECCTPQHFSMGYPNVEWTLEELTAYAQAQHHAIADDERKLAVKYWRLGLALNLLRGNFNHGQWERLLQDMQIEKTKASRARAIARTFDKEEEVAHLTLKEAYERRVRRTRKSSSQNATAKGAGPDDRLGRFLDHVTKMAEIMIDDAGFAEQAQAVVLLEAVNAAMAKLQRIHELLSEQAQGT